MMELLLKMNEQLTETEKELEQALKDKQPSVPVSTTGQPTELSQVNTSNLSTEEIIKSMNDLKLQVT